MKAGILIRKVEYTYDSNGKVEQINENQYDIEYNVQTTLTGNVSYEGDNISTYTMNGNTISENTIHPYLLFSNLLMWLKFYIPKL